MRALLLRAYDSTMARLGCFGCYIGCATLIAVPVTLIGGGAALAVALL